MTTVILPSADYTPGPWIVCEALKRGFCVRSARGGFLAWVGCGSERRDAANAQLMAAAPRLLDYCRSLLADAERLSEQPDAGPGWDWQLTRTNLRGLIGLAEGDPRYADRPYAGASRR